MPVLSCAKHAPAMAPLQVGMHTAQRTLSETVHSPRRAQTTGRMAASAAWPSAATTTARALPAARPAEATKSVQPLAASGPALVLHSDADRREFISAGAAWGAGGESWSSEPSLAQ